jgi:hypothetical protein
LPEGLHVEIRLEPGELPAALPAEMEAWEVASDEAWKSIDELESPEK